MITVKHLTKRYGSHLAVDDISFTVQDGEIVGFLGPNGAGKSTTMNMLTGYISSSSGEALINETDILDNPIRAKRDIGYLPELPPLYQEMTVMRYLHFVYDLKKCKLPRKAHLTEICNLCKIADVKDRIIKNLSKGYRQRVGLAQALVGNPPILILDEPTVGLDPNQMLEMRTLIKRLGKRHTVILSSHILSEIQAVCDRVIIINKGKIVADGAIDTLAQSMSQNHRLKVRLDGNVAEVLQTFRAIEGVAKVQQSAQQESGLYDYELEPIGNADLRKAVNAAAQANGWNIYRMESGMLTLEDIFLKVTMGEWQAEQKSSVSAAAVKKSAESAEMTATIDDKPETTEEEAK
ncbi:MAG: ATP-binding cassette domain-containing protein [Oscillospiraceae bacterium]|nr:ATP-binding cassette domain-containing protein [Oscillospiraceae bacterium]